MPELPEVETVRRTLAPRVIGRRIRRVVVRERRLRRRVAADFARRLTGRTITDLRRVGKYLLFGLDNSATWVVHLGMTGCLATGRSATIRHVHVKLDLSDGTTLTYEDPRRFGLMEVAVDTLPAEVRLLGVDPLSKEFTPDHLQRLTRGRRRPIKTLLMDQRLIAGLGNIYANELLFQARVRPTRRCAQLRKAEIGAICEATKVVLTEAIAMGGSSISDYRDGEGQPGYFQLRLHVYDRAGEPCLRCRHPIRTRVQAGRSSFYCPNCQH